MRFRPAFALVGMMAMAASVSPAVAQFRPNMPTVSVAPVVPDAGIDDRRVLADFARWNGERQRPPVLVLWDRTFSDEATTRTRSRLSDQVVTAAGPGVVVSQRDLVIGDERLSDDVTPRHDAVLAEIEDAYLASLLGAGAAIVDRNTLMRRASLGVDRPDRADQQFLETLAVTQGVRYLVEVLPSWDAGSPTGMSATVKITDLASARIVARFVTVASPPVERRRLAPGPGGFHREASSRPTPSQIGTRLALESMASLTATR